MQAEQHGHGSDECTVARCDFVNALKDQIAQNPTHRVRQTYDRTVAQLPIPNANADEDYVPEFRQLKSALNRKRREFYPPIPWRIRDVNISNEWARTWSNQIFVCYQNNISGFVLFLTARNCSRLVTCEEIFIDGTFKSCPRPYYQLLTIHGRYHDHVQPLAFCLMKNKALWLYRKVIRKVKDRVRRHWSAVCSRPYYMRLWNVTYSGHSDWNSSSKS